MLWVAVHCHRLALDVFERGLEQPLIAVCDRQQLLQVTAAAAALGLRPGMKRATALALAPALILAERNPAAERDALEQIATWTLQFSPCVSLQPPDGILIEIEPSLRLFGGEQRLLDRLRQGIGQLGFALCMASAPTASGAWLMARWRDGASITHESQLHAQLAPLPLLQMDSAAPHLQTLAGIGARTFGDLARLPRAGLARRFGKTLLAELDTALGRLPEPRRWFEAPPRFDVRLELPSQVEHAEALLFAARRLLLQLCGWLTARHAVAQHAVITGEHDSDRHAHAATRIELRLSQPSRDPERLLGVLRERLAVTRLPAPVHTLRLSCERISPLAGTHGELFPVPASGTEALGRLVERLQARLGREQVQRLVLAADHRPEAAYRIEPLSHLAQPASPARSANPAAHDAAAGDHARGLPGIPRPLWLLQHPVPLHERNDRPWWQGPLTLLAGPERIEGGWWDGHLVQRDYFVAESETAGWLWIYRTRASEAAASGDASRNGEPTGGWFLQGVFG